MRGTVLTNDGMQLIAKLVASGQPLVFSRVAVGTGSIPSGYDPQNMKNLSNYKMDGTISSCSASGDIASIVFQISSVNVTLGFTVTESGIFANDPDKGEILYSYLDMTEDPQYVYASGSAITKFIEMTLEVVIGSAANVTAYINPNSMVKKAVFDQAVNRVENLESGNTQIKIDEDIDGEFPVPEKEESSKTFMGKVKKFIQDFNDFKAGIITVGRLINNGQTTEPGFALDARYGTTLTEQLAQLNANMGKLPNRIQTGEVWVTPSAPNVVTSVYVPFPTPFPGAPIILLTARTAGPGSNVLGIGFTNENQDGFTLHTMRNNTQEFSVTWVALY